VVGKRLAACAQITGPVSSTYWWKGALESADEWRIDFKTRSKLYPALEQALKAVHPYDTPEIVAVPIGAGYDRYIAWLGNETAEHGA